jgi:dTDP-4-amino-4,6-dideoxygalactose transaminase
MHPAIAATKGILMPGWTSQTDFVPAYEQAFVRTLLTGTEKAMAFGRGRVALWTILKAIGVEAGSQVILPCYTCETVPMAVKFAGGTCVYADVSPGACNVSQRDVGALITSRTKAIICQHTYGIVQPVQEWIRLAAEAKVVLIEDRCQLIQNDLTGDVEPAFGDAAYFSTHFSKPFSTTQGGMAVFREARLRAAADEIREQFSRDRRRQQARSLAIQTLLYGIVARPATRALAGVLYRGAQRAGLIRGSISTDEYGNAMPPDYLSCGNNLHAVLGMAHLAKWEQNRRHREQLTCFYLEQLQKLGMDTRPLNPDGRCPALLMVPVLVENKGPILRGAMAKGLPIGTWFDRPGAHVQARSAKLYDYTPGRCPCSEYLMSKEVHLLTGPWVNRRQADRAVRFLSRHACLANPWKPPARAESPRPEAKRDQVATRSEG